MITMETIVAQDREPVAATVDDEVVMLSIRAGAYFGLNGVGSEIWNLLREPQRVGDLCRVLTALYEVDEPTLRDDVLRFLRDLHGRGLLRIVRDDGAST